MDRGVNVARHRLQSLWPALYNVLGQQDFCATQDAPGYNNTPTKSHPNRVQAKKTSTTQPIPHTRSAVPEATYGKLAPMTSCAGSSLGVRQQELETCD